MFLWIQDISAHVHVKRELRVIIVLNKLKINLVRVLSMLLEYDIGT